MQDLRKKLKKHPIKNPYQKHPAKTPSPAAEGIFAEKLSKYFQALLYKHVGWVERETPKNHTHDWLSRSSETLKLT